MVAPGLCETQFTVIVDMITRTFSGKPHRKRPRSGSGGYWSRPRKDVPIWDSSDVLVTIISKRHHRPDPAHRIIFGHASHRWLRFRAGNNKGLAGIASFGKARGSMPMGQVDSFANSGPDLAESLNIGQQE